MRIEYVEIGNYRKLRAVRIDFTESTTVFVGANNSGKTSAMVALRHFLVDKRNFSVNDITLMHWPKLDALGKTWESAKPGEAETPFDWNAILPHLDVWLRVLAPELHYVQKLLPTLDWNGELVGVRLRYEPKDLTKLRQEYLSERAAAQAVLQCKEMKSADAAAETGNEFSLWPKGMMDFLTRRLRATFEIKAYLLDPAKVVTPKDGIACPQDLVAGSEPLDGSDPFAGLVRIDEISAQRGFGATSGYAYGSDEVDDLKSSSASRRLSQQLQAYYKQHLDPFDQPEPEDLDALEALQAAQDAFAKRLSVSFTPALTELETLGYPGLTDPKLTISTSIKPVDGLSHASAVLYEVPTYHVPDGGSHRLPEDSNGLGYQNLISMVFALMSFRDRWMRVGKASRNDDESLIPPLHLVLVEEPEAHLHAQVQQVFIKQAYEVLRNHPGLKGSTELNTQLVVSTHSSHLAHEAEFASLRYFRRLPVDATAGSVPLSSVMNLSEVFGTKDDNERFVRRYLKATHCDLFFADAAVLVEGPAERILVPHFVRKRDNYKYLRRCYITWLEVGGSHAHRLRPLIDHLGLHTLVVTDLDAKNADGTSVPPARGEGQLSRNDTLKTWVPVIDALDALLDKKESDLTVEGAHGAAVRVAYQQPIKTSFQKANAELLANTFEDALLYENLGVFQAQDGNGLWGHLHDAATTATTVQELGEKVKEALKKGGKAQFAMDLLYSKEIETLSVPRYIDDGLKWLIKQLERRNAGIVGGVQLAAAVAAAAAGQAPATAPSPLAA